MATSVGLSGIAPKAANAWKPEPYEMVEGEITYVGTSISDSYDRKKKELELRVDLQTPQGTKVSVWATMETDVDPATGQPTPDSYPKRDARAIAAAVQATGSTDIEVGGYLKIQRVADEATDFGDAKTFVAEYTKPRPKVASVGLPPTDTPTQPRPAAQPAPGAFQAPPAQGFQPQAPAPAPVPTQGFVTAPPALGPITTMDAMAAGLVRLQAISAVYGIPVETLAAMPPEQLAGMEAVMANMAQPAPAPQAPPANPLGGLMAPRPQ